MRKRNKTVGELIDALQGFDPKMEVRFTYDYGDHWNSQVAEAVTGAEEGAVAHSEYHRMDKVVSGLEEAKEEGEKVVAVVLIRGRKVPKEE